MPKPLHPDQYEELLSAAETYVKKSQHEYMDPSLADFIAAVKKARQSQDRLETPVTEPVAGMVAR